ncbi:8-oxo-dGTP pyrophosphatase MutT (NUDIX family) [Nocardiopsis arvandica]|uniref:8-oxo-dGTP pyrophosphatase MutT (NUDIX family) n=2 Tax=Nocardiopsis sinuspersici TaxID=501010 RepID=A0A7Z0BKP8_9ACTN|nr:8-oxo-dGTP pyrophosphatase MutT (NUDIX family) [Nocardiopsis sinuspersici]
MHHGSEPSDGERGGPGRGGRDGAADDGAVPTRPAATVMLLRPAEGARGAAAGADRSGAGTDASMEVLLMRRVRSMGFAPGAFVFPGGGVDERDADGGVPWTGPSPEEWARTLGTDVPMARALVCAAVRETFEETGVLLAGEPGSADEEAITLDTDTEEWERDRLGLIDRSRAFTEVLSRRGLVLRSEWLRAWSRWITPRTEPRRYDTWFFAAELPPGQVSRDVGGEADLTRWTDPAAVASEWEAGRMPMLPPTAVSCAELADCRTLRGVREARRDIVPIEPVIREVDGRLRVVAPNGVDYPLPKPGAAP